LYNGIVGEPVIEWIHIPMYTVETAPKLDRWLNYSQETQLMSNKTISRKIKETALREFDISEYLDSQEAIAEYLTAMIETGDASMVAVALGDVARAKGMADVAKTSGLTREALYKALRQDAQPRFDTVNRVCLALGIKLVVQPQ
jgi:probable addiction module antidote protein